MAQEPGFVARVLRLADLDSFAGLRAMLPAEVSNSEGRRPVDPVQTARVAERPLQSLWAN